MEAIHEAVKVTTPFPPESRATAETQYNDAAIGAALGIDTRDFDEAMITVHLGVVGATTLDVSVGFADIDDAEDASFVEDAAHALAQIVNADDGKTFLIRISVQDTKRYMFVKTIQADAVAVLSCISVELSKADDLPVTQEQTVAFKDESAA